MESLSALKGRHAVREYTSEGVDDATLERLIDAAIQAPSAVNTQPWTFTVVRDTQELDRLAEEAKAHMRATIPAEHADRFSGLLCALAAENLMLAAHAEGLGTCWIGFSQSYLNTSQGKRLVGIPDAWVPVAPIIVGHPRSMQPVAHDRRKPVVRWIN